MIFLQTGELLRDATSIYGSGSGLNTTLTVAMIILGVGVLGVLGFVFLQLRKNKKSWNVTFRVRVENNEEKRISIDPGIIMARRITLPNGVPVFELEKPLLGFSLVPLLNHNTRPGVYDIILSSDNRIFLIDGIKSIDAQRRELQVGLRYPGIDHALGEIDKDYKELNKQKRKSELLDIIKYASFAIIAIALLIGLIVGGKYYLEGRQIEADKATKELQLYQSLESLVTAQEEQQNSMILLVAKLKEVLETDDLRRELNKINNTI